MEVGSGSQWVMNTFLIRGPCLTLEKLAMKKSLIALAVLTASGISFAQSTVTLFGGADLNYRNVETGANKFSGMAQDGIYSSRFGVMGVEDLGGGLKAGFHFEGGLAPDVGSSAGLNFTRKQTLGLMGGFGEVRLGRDYTPLFTVFSVADPFGTNGVGSSYNVANGVTISGAANANAGNFGTAQAAAASTVAASTVAAGTVYADPFATRANNSVAYYSPNFNGFGAWIMYSFGAENTNVGRDAGTMTSVRLNYAQGPVVVTYGNQTTKGGVATTAAADTQDWKTNMVAASYNFGPATLRAGYKTDKASFLADTIKTTILGVTAPMGALTLRASYVSAKFGSADMANQAAVGVIYDLSKRTSLYSTYSALDNGSNFGKTVGSAAASDFTGLTSKGFEMGVKHNF
jgi:predicted porin